MSSQIGTRVTVNTSNINFFLAKLDQILNLKILNVLAFPLTIVTILIFLTSYFSHFSPIIYFALFNLLAVSLFFVNVKLYHVFKIKNYIPRISINNTLSNIQSGNQTEIGSLLDYDTCRIFKLAYLSDPDSFFIALSKTDQVRFIFYKAGISFQELVGVSTATTIDQVFLSAIKMAGSFEQKLIGSSDLFWGFYETSNNLRRFFADHNLKEDDVYNIVFWEKTIWDEEQKKRHFLDPDHWISTGGIGKSWSTGYTQNLDVYAKDMTQMISKGIARYSVISRMELVDAMQTILTKSHSHLIMVGEAGVGKKSLVREFAKQVLYGKVMPSLKYRRILELETGALLAGASQKEGEVELRFKSILNDACRAGNIILFIDDIDALLLEEGQGSVNAAQVLIPYLESGALQLIGATTPEKWHKICANSKINNYFNKLVIPEGDENVTLRILQDLSFQFEYKYKITVTYQSLKEAYRDAKKYIPYKAFPAKAIDLLEESCIKTQNMGLKVLSPEIIQKTVSQNTNIPVQEASGNEKDVLLNLESFLHQRVVGQDDAVKAVANAMRRARAGLESGKRPVASFLFLGPTGVGKTELSKALAESYFGSEQNMVRLDMSEYQNDDAIHKLLGSENEAGGYLTKPVREKPFSLVLLDEIEKANPDILNLFLQILDDGRITDNLERTIDFTHTIIIATSNAGSEIIRERATEGTSSNKEFAKILMDKLLRDGIFRPEFVNRFDSIITFDPLNELQIREIAELMIKEIQKKLLAERDRKLEVTDQAVTKLASLGFDPQYGAREMRRVMQEQLENFIAKKVLGDEEDKDTPIVFDVGDIEE